MNRTLNKIFIAVFILLCIIPSAGMLVFGQSEAAANEILSPEPAIVNEEGRFNVSVLSEFSDWFGDRFALRQQLSTLWAQLNAKLFGNSVEDQVILGEDGWLFFSETLDDFRGVTLSDSEISAAAENLRIICDYCSERGIDFVFTVAPNKNSLYPGFMPSYIAPGNAVSNARRLYSELDGLGVNYIDLHELFESQHVLYFKTDSHWNSRGAALAADALLHALGRKSDYSSLDFSSPAEHEGDLYAMLYPAGNFRETDMQPSEPFGFNCLNDPNGGNAINIRTQNDASEGSLMCWRDSFGISLYPYLAESFGSARFSRSAKYDLSVLDGGEYDAVIIEIVERNIGNLAGLDLSQFRE